MSPRQTSLNPTPLKYCEIDTQVLKAGFEKFRTMVLEAFDIDVNSHCTIASMADKFYMDQGVYNGVCELRGCVRDFIAQASPHDH
eukprot:scaffold70079_cov33-Tisochrysis_lutea.AAC.1